MITWYMLVLLSRFEIIWQAISVEIFLVQDDVIIEKRDLTCPTPGVLSIFWAEGRGVHLGRQRRLSRPAQPRGLCESTGRIRGNTRETPCSSRFRAAKGGNINNKGGEYYVYQSFRPFKRPEEDPNSNSSWPIKQSVSELINQSINYAVRQLVN